MAIPTKISFRAPLIVLMCCATAGALIYLLGNWHTNRLATEESERLGQALAAQLVETIRQPILHNDLVSLQVSVEQLVDRAEVAGAAVYNPQQKLLAQSKAKGFHRQADLALFREPLAIEGKTVAFAGVDINTASLLARYRTPLNWTLMIWLLFSAGITAVTVVTSRNLSHRLNRLYLSLPGDESQAADELGMLEQRLAPLLTQNLEIEQNDTPVHQIATVALHCKNLERLEAQLSKENLQRLLNQLDDDLEQVTTLYDGKRLPGREHTLFIEFSGASAQGDHPLRALFCAHILLQLSASHTQSLGVGLDLSAAVRLSVSESDTSLMGDFEREKRQTEVSRLARLGEHSEILLDSSTRLHNTLVDTITTDEISESSDIHRVETFSASHNSLLEKQLTYLRAHQV